MKTSNKLLMGLIGFMISAMLIFVIFGRFSMESFEQKIVKGNGNMSEEIREVEPFSGFEIGSGMLATLKKGDQGVKIIGESNVLEFVETKVINGELKIGWADETSMDLTQEISVEITLPTLSYLSAHSSAIVKTADNFSNETIHIYASSGSEVTLQGLTATELTMDLSSSSIVRLNQEVAASESVSLQLSSGSELTFKALQSEKLETNISSSSVLSVTGSAVSLVANSSSRGELKGANFAVQAAILKGSSSSIFEIEVNDLLQADLNSSSEVWYRGNALVNKQLSGESFVKKID